MKINKSDIASIVESVLNLLNEGGNADVENLIQKKVGEVLETISLYEATNPKNFREIKYFSTDGSAMPNGTGYQRGNFLHECKVNRDAFILDEAVHNNQYGLENYRGGVIVFSTDVNAVSLDKNKVANKLKQVFVTLNQRLNVGKITHNIINKFNKYGDEYIGAYSVGNAFKGRYVGDNGELYNENSTTVEINGLSSDGLLRLAEMIARVFHQETVLVKDFNNMKFYLANGLRSDKPANFSNINKKA